MMLACDLVVRRGTFSLAAAFEVDAAETVAIVGPNGAGKSTLVRALAGLEPAADGTIELDGRRVDRLPPERRRIGVVFQERLLFPHLSALENVAYPMRLRGVGARRARRRAGSLLTRLGASAVEDAAPDRLSGGEAARVALARALATEPDALILDEPFSSLDPASRPDVRAAVAAELAGFDGPRIVVTHDPVEALVLADRVVVLEHGRVTQAGTPAELRRHPAGQFVASLVGLSVIRGRVRHEAGRALLVTGGDTIAVETGYSGDAYAIVRPQAVALYRQPPGGSPMNVLRRRVESIAAEGGRALVTLAGDPVVVAEITASSVTRLALAPDDEIYAAFKATDVDVWPAS